MFFPLPDGNGLLHTFTGTAEPPKQIVMPTRDVPCKTKHIEILQIGNWLKKRQRFRVQIEMAKSDGSRNVGSAARPGTGMVSFLQESEGSYVKCPRAFFHYFTMFKWKIAKNRSRKHTDSDVRVNWNILLFLVVCE